MQCRDLKLHVGCKLLIPPQCRTRLGHLKLMLFLGLQSSKVSAFAKWRRKASLLIKIHDHGISPVSRTIAQTRNTACVLTELENDFSFGVSSYTRNWKKLSSYITSAYGTIIYCITFVGCLGASKTMVLVYAHKFTTRNPISLST